MHFFHRCFGQKSLTQEEKKEQAFDFHFENLLLFMRLIFCKLLPANDDGLPYEAAEAPVIRFLARQ
jgi:hypothetical protein